MSLQAAKRNGYAIMPTNTKIVTADGGSHKVAGETDRLKVNVNNHLAEIKFLVLDQDNHDTLLGLDWFHATDASYQPSRNVLKFAGSVVYLSNDYHEVEDLSRETQPEVSEIIDDVNVYENEFVAMDEVPIQTETKLEGELKMKFETTCVPLIKQLYAWETSDVGKSNLGEINIELTDNTPIFMQYFRRSDAK